MIGNRTLPSMPAGRGWACCRWPGGAGLAAAAEVPPHAPGALPCRCPQPDHRTARHSVADHGEAGPEEKTQRPLVEVCRTGLRPQFRVHGVAFHHGGAVGKRMADGGAKERCGHAAAAVAGGDDEAAHRPDGPSA
jgi:hypothetical protein